MTGSIVIVGGGECGTRAAFALREIGDDCSVTLIGGEPDLPYERPPLSKEALASAENDVVPKTIATQAAFDAAGIHLLTGTKARMIDRGAKRVRLADGAPVPYDRLLIATGATPRRLALVPADDERCAYLRTLDDARRIKRHLRPDSRVAIVGGGFIGLELAATARKRGAAVVVLEALPRILTRTVPEEVARVVHDRQLAEGVEIVCNAEIVSIVPGADSVEIVLGTGRHLSADFVVVGIGVVPVVDLAQEAGLAIDNGIAVDETLRTSDPDIFAAGDCCSFPLALYDGRRVRLEAWRNAIDQGNLAARNMRGAEEPHTAVPWFWSDQHDLTLQIAGQPGEGTATVRRDLGTAAFILFHIAADGRLVAASGIGPGNAVARDMRIAEILVARRARPAPAVLVAPETKLKSLLAA